MMVVMIVDNGARGYYSEGSRWWWQLQSALKVVGAMIAMVT